MGHNLWPMIILQCPVSRQVIRLNMAFKSLDLRAVCISKRQERQYNFTDLEQMRKSWEELTQCLTLVLY